MSTRPNPSPSISPADCEGRASGLLSAINLPLGELLDRLPEAVFVFGEQGRVRLFNSTAMRLFAASGEELQGRRVLDLILAPSAGAASLPEDLKTLGDTDRAIERERRMVSLDGRSFAAETTLVRLRDHDIIGPGTLFVVRDISHRKANEAQILRRTRQLGILHQVSTLLNRSLEMRQALPDALDKLRTLLRCDAVAFFTADRWSTDNLRLYWSAGLNLRDGEETLLSLEAESPERLAARSRQVVFVENLAQTARGATPFHDADISAAAYLPLESRQNFMGVLALGRRKQESFSGENVDLFLPLAQLLSTAIENIRLYSGMKALNEQLLGLHELSVRLAHQTEETGALRDTLSTVSRQLGSDLALFFAPKDGRLRPVEWLGLSAAEEPLLEELAFDLGSRAPVPLAVEVFRSGKHSQQTRGPAESPHSRWGKLLLRRSIGSVIAAPVMDKIRPIGTLVLYFPAMRRLEKNDIRVMNVALRQAGASLQNTRLIEDLQIHRRKLERLSSRILSAQEEERRHLSRELHDGIGQSLSALKLNLETFATRAPEGATSADMDRVLEICADTIAELRRISHDLRPSILDDLGLIATVKWHAGRFQEQVGVQVNVSTSGQERVLGPLKDVNLYRIVQEALTNVARHARADSVEISFDWRHNCLNLSLRDDGCGYDPGHSGSGDAAGLGLVGIKERVHLMGGSVRIWSARGAGTHMDIDIPLEDSPAETTHPGGAS